MACLFGVQRRLYIAVAERNSRRYSLLGLPPVSFHLLRVSNAYASGSCDVRVLICDDAAHLLARTCLCLPPVSILCALGGCVACLLIRGGVRRGALDDSKQRAPQLEGFDDAHPARIRASRYITEQRDGTPWGAYTALYVILNSRLGAP